jgi:hypothetical protein
MSMRPSEIIHGRRSAGRPLRRALGHSVFTEADDLEALRDAVPDAVRCHSDDAHGPEVIRLHLVREESLRHETAERPVRI